MVSNYLNRIPRAIVELFCLLRGLMVVLHGSFLLFSVIRVWFKKLFGNLL